MRRLSLLLTSLFLIAGCGSDQAPPAATPATPGTSATTSPSAVPSLSPDSLFGSGTLTITTDAGQLTLAVEVASTAAAQQQGLMGRTDMPPDTGMVFVFPDEQPRKFWMKDTLIPLSIAFYDAEGTIVSIVDMEPCGDQPSCPLYDSEAPAQGALEVEQGYFEANGVEVGDTATLSVATV